MYSTHFVIFLFSPEVCLIAPDFTISVYGSSCNYLSFYLFANPRHEECQGIYMRKKRRQKRETYINCCTHNCKIFDSPLQCFLNSIAQLLSELGPRHNCCDNQTPFSVLHMFEWPKILCRNSMWTPRGKHFFHAGLLRCCVVAWRDVENLLRALLRGFCSQQTKNKQKVKSSGKNI